MKTVGEILKKARTEKGLELDDIEKQLRIRKKFLEALEENEWNRLPSTPYIKGFLRNYSLFLGLKPEEMVAIFRRQFGEQQRAGLIPEGLTHPLNEPLFKLTPQTAVLGIISLFLIFFFGYLIFQYKSYISPPELAVNQPKEGEILTSSRIQVEGKTDNDAVISVNNQKIALGKNGEFSTIISLLPGVNVITIESTSKYGKKRTLTRTVEIAENTR